MSVFEEKGIITYKNKDGDLYQLFPVTKIECVEGLEGIGEHLESTGNPHGSTAEDVGAIPVENIATIEDAEEFLDIRLSDGDGSE